MTQTRWIVEPLDGGRVLDAAGLFVEEFRGLRRAVPVLSRELESIERVGEKLDGMRRRSLAAFEDGRLVGYLAWWQIERFRGSGRRGAYIPEWGHGAAAGHRAAIYRALYRAASAEWAAAGCEVHAISLLAHDQEAREAWFWNGFGLAVVDGARTAVALDPEPRCNLSVRQARPEDAGVLSALDAEHVRHYASPPVFMTLPHPESAADFAAFMAQPKNSVWLAFDGAEPAGFMRFTGYDFDAVAVLVSDSAAFCNAAFVRPAYRGRGAGVGLLQAALRHYAGMGLRGLFTNFESFNPEAAGFWPRYFDLVCLSLMRVPETPPRPSA